MQRPIVEFSRDDRSDWTARLSCGHAQHTRHDPPFVERPWVLTEAGRQARVGTPLDCVRCDRGELPEGHVAYQRTKSFDATSVPVALTKNHTTQSGVWGLIHVEAGALEYTIEDARLPADCQRIERIEAGRSGVVIPEVEHRVRPLGDVLFHVEFWRREVATESVD